MSSVTRVELACHASAAFDDLSMRAAGAFARTSGVGDEDLRFWVVEKE
jgi:hypothetical protein